MFNGDNPPKSPLRVFAVIALGAAFVLMTVVAARKLFVGEYVFNARRPFPARVVDPFRDRFQIREVFTSIKRHLDHTCPDVCGLAAPHLGLALQLAVVRRVNKDLLELRNPRWTPHRDSEWADVSRLVGPSDPMCRKAVTAHNSFTVATSIHVWSGEIDEYDLDGRDARCAQQLIRLMNMNKSEDWPCVLADPGSAEFLSMYL